MATPEATARGAGAFASASGETAQAALVADVLRYPFAHAHLAVRFVGDRTIGGSAVTWWTVEEKEKVVFDRLPHMNRRARRRALQTGGLKGFKGMHTEIEMRRRELTAGEVVAGIEAQVEAKPGTALDVEWRTWVPKQGVPIGSPYCPQAELMTTGYLVPSLCYNAPHEPVVTRAEHDGRGYLHFVRFYGIIGEGGSALRWIRSPPEDIEIDEEQSAAWELFPRD
ncbi:hypothetical protein DFJ74DRAFT_724031 [Hyaloraphidium curvatum]|nr:hypothetical protein DFJ74DRAFT_724031 [Hyaloraphidium curvatum]